MLARLALPIIVSLVATAAPAMATPFTMQCHGPLSSTVIFILTIDPVAKTVTGYTPGVGQDPTYTATTFTDTEIDWHDTTSIPADAFLNRQTGVLTIKETGNYQQSLYCH